MSYIIPTDDEDGIGEPRNINFTNLSDLVPSDSMDELVDLSDESSDFDESVEAEEYESDINFYANLASDLDNVKLSALAGRLLEKIREDKESREEWEKTINLAIKYLGFRIEEFRNVPFVQACAAYDTTLATALIRFYSVARAELFPASGPVRAEISGVPTEEIEESGERVKKFMNYYLTKVDRDYYHDSERLLMYVGLFGCAFRKVYQDPILNRPIARLISPQDFIVDHNTTSILSSTMMTHVMPLTRKEVILREKIGTFIESSLPEISEDNMNDEPSSIEKTIKKIEGINTNSTENKSLFKFYEIHVDLHPDEVEPNFVDESDNDLPRPYIVTICDSNRKVVSILRNWKEGDSTFTRKEYFVHYYYLSGFGMYGLGLAHLMGSNAIALTSIQRQLIDAGLLRNFPGGLKQKGLRIENNDKSIGPGEFHEVDCGGLPIAQAIMLMPYQEPSQVLMELSNRLMQKTEVLGSTAETAIPEAGTNAPVGTTLALLEVANKIQSSILRSQHVSLGYEFKLLFDLFAEYFPDEPYPFSVPGSQSLIMREDFNENVNIVPVSDPNVLTSTHRLLRAQAQLTLAQSAPEIHNMKEAYRNMYKAMDIDNIDKLLLPDEKAEALDPITENMNAFMNKELTISLFQDDEAHIIVHNKFIQDMQSNPQMFNPQAIAMLTMHNQKHELNKILKQLLSPQGIDVSQIQDDQIETMPGIKNMVPHIQNMLAEKDAQKTMQQIQQQQELLQQQQQPIDPNQILMADIKQREQAAILKEEESKLKAETEAFKAQLKFESDKAKLEAEQDMAEEKNQVDLTIAQMKQTSTE